MNTNNFCIIMAGGTSSAFWPLTKGSRSKQFLDILGSGESLLQATFRRFTRICPRENIFIVTSAALEQRVHQQIPGLRSYQVLPEPERRNTAPCVAYAAAIINDINPNANIIVSPSDHAIYDEDLFVQYMDDAIAVADRYDWIVMLGAQPTQPNTKYGYIQFDEMPATVDASDLHRVITFTEKPPLEMAQRFIATGEFLWNTGVFVWRLPVLLRAFQLHLPSVYEHFSLLSLDSPRDQVVEAFAQTESISLDFGIMEKADNVFVMKTTFGWSDVETWDSVFEAAPKNKDANVVASGHVLAYDSHNCVFHLPPDITLIAQGLTDYVVSFNGSVLLVAPRDCQDNTIKYDSDLEMSKTSK